MISRLKNWVQSLILGEKQPTVIEPTAQVSAPAEPIPHVVITPKQPIVETVSPEPKKVKKPKSTTASSEKTTKPKAERQPKAVTEKETKPKAVRKPKKVDTAPNP